MPTYDYKCSTPGCDYCFEKNLPIDKRNDPEMDPCPICGNKTIQMAIGAPIVNLGFRGSTIQSHAPAEFKEHLQKIKKKAGPGATGIEL